MSEPADIHALYVGDETDPVDAAADRLERRNERFTVDEATDASGGLDRLGESEYDCVVSGYRIPGGDGIEFLEAVREEYPDLPFVLFTGEGSEEVASDAFTAGATDYVQRGSDTGQFERLANRIEDAVEQCRSERRAEDARRMLGQLVERADSILFVFTGDWSELLFVNSAFEDIWGRPVERLEDDPESFLENIHPEDRGKARRSMETLSNGNSDEIEYRVVRPDGECRWIHAESKPIFDDEGNVTRIAGYVRDITERKRREHDLKRERDRYTTLFDNLPNPVVHGRMEGGEAIVEAVNPAFEDTFGYERAVIEGSPLHDHILPEEETDVGSLNRRLLDRGEVSTELRRRTDDGVREFRVDITLRNADAETPEGYAIYTDITERKEHEDALKQLHAATRDLMTATTTEAVATIGSETASQVLDHPTNSVHVCDADADALAPVAWADGYEECAGGPPPVFPVGDSLPGQVYRSGEAEIYTDIPESGGPFGPDTPFRSRYVLPLGDYGVFVLSSPEPDGFDATDEALTRVLAANVEAAFDRVEQRQSLERERDRLNEFAGVVSHDLRNPLNVVMGRVELAQRECDSDHLDAASEGLDRMSQLIDRTLTLARSGQIVGETERIELSVLTRQCWQDVDTARADLRTEDPPEVRGDPERLRHLFENLYRNAVEHGGEDVTVTVGGLGTGFYIEDDGPGVAEDEREEILAAGYSTTEDGTGLGLSIVRQIVEAHGWEVTVTDSASGGARFEVTDVEVVDG